LKLFTGVGLVRLILLFIKTDYWHSVSSSDCNSGISGILSFQNSGIFSKKFWKM